MNPDNGLGIGTLLNSAKQLQQAITQAKEDMGRLTVQGTAGGGAVKATVSGKGTLENIVISSVVADPNNAQGLAELVISAIKNAQEALMTQHEERLLPMLETLHTELQGFSS
ncbi:YbaB/EbfC family nucleoid-associated protein [Streptomyces sp. NPDC008061]|uniref:YbaB/EbfC family nucleoid-associated protein n=1 Tax=Streptomyces sp. NPDC008061 TaxID=3364805 RepID=UPI0036EC758A